MRLGLADHALGQSLVGVAGCAASAAAGTTACALGGGAASAAARSTAHHHFFGAAVTTRAARRSRARRSARPHAALLDVGDGAADHRQQLVARTASHAAARFLHPELERHLAVRLFVGVGHAIPFASADLRHLGDRFTGVTGSAANVAQVIEERVHRHSANFFYCHSNGVWIPGSS